MLETIIIVLLVFISVQEFFNKKERQKLVEALIAKNLREVSDLEQTRKTKPDKEELPPEAVLQTELDDTGFDKMINNINGKKQ